MKRPLPLHELLFVRHGATQPNLDGVRCGGDVDVPLTELGRQQIALAAQQMRSLGIDTIVCSDLQRTVHSARIVSEALGGVPVRVIPEFRERLLGQWNGQPIEHTEAALRAGETPPGGESNETFRARTQQALDALAALPCRRPLVVASKGVARMLREVLGLPAQAPARNGELIRFDWSAWRDAASGAQTARRCAP
jgi:2,3-bisphosphoglycerate-dependent phosphoglycerate mutase